VDAWALYEAAAAAREACWGWGEGIDAGNSVESPINVSLHVAEAIAFSSHSPMGSASWPKQNAAELTVHCDYLRDIFGDPFKPTKIDLTWRTPATIKLSQHIYAQCAYEKIPQLAQPLRQAGCIDSRILNHCLGKGPHAKGCWVIDQLLGRN